MKRTKLAGLLFSISPTLVFAQVDPFAMSMEELMSVPVSVSSRTPLTQREAPSIISVITAQEIRNSGARNLIDILRHVPGVSFRMMVNNAIGLGMRGQIGSDGRVLMLVDGIEMNEHRYGSAVFGTDFPVEQIARIEIIRGSGLALYGGAAEFGVINIITHSADDLDGINIELAKGYAPTSNLESRDKFSLMAGKQLDTVKLSAMLHASHGMRSDRTYYNVGGNSFDMAGNNDVALQNANFGLAIGNFNARIIIDKPQIMDRDSAGFRSARRDPNMGIRAIPASNTYNSESYLAQYKLIDSDTISFTPSLLYQYQSPRKTIDTRSNTLLAETQVNRLQAKLPFTWNTNKNLHLAAGIEHTKDEYTAVIRSASVSSLPALPYPSTSILGIYGEAIWKQPWGNLTTSLRQDRNNRAGDWRTTGILNAIRIGYTKTFDNNWHIKTAASHARSAPWMETWAPATTPAPPSKPFNVVPETTRTWEMEVGYMINSNSQITANVYDITTYDFILLENLPTIRTRGLETIYKLRQPWGYADITYSYYQANGTQTLNPLGIQSVQPYDLVTGALMDGKSHLAFPSHKLTANFHYEVTPTFSINPSLIYFGPRWGYTAPMTPPTGGAPTLTRMTSKPLLNMALVFDKVANSNLTLVASGHNLLNSDISFIQPFSWGLHAPLPDMSREFMLKAQYKF